MRYTPYILNHLRIHEEVENSEEVKEIIIIFDENTKITCTAWKSKSLEIAHIVYEPVLYVLNTKPSEIVKTPIKREKYNLFKIPRKT